MIFNFSYCPDLEAIPSITVGGMPNSAIAIGWLGDNLDFTQGIVPEPFLVKLAGLIDDSRCTVTVLRGYQPCSFCDYCGLISDVHPRLGGAVLLVPDQKEYFVAPDLILHYVQKHHYCPPRKFMSGVISFEPSPSFQARELLNMAS